MLLLNAAPFENREAKGFNKLYCNLCQRYTFHYKPSDNNPAHCTEHSSFPNPQSKRMSTQLTVDCQICEKPVLKLLAKPFLKFDNVCPSCIAAELASLQANPHVDAGATTEELSNRVVNAPAVETNKREQFFVAEREALSALTGTIAEQYTIVKARIAEWQEVLFEVGVKKEVNYMRLQELARQLRADEREALGIKHVEYNPGALNLSNVKPVVKKERMSAGDKTTQKMAMTLFGKKITLGNVVQQEIFKSHPEYYVEGRLKAEYREQVEAIYQSKGAMTEEMAIKMVETTIRGAKASTISKIASGEIHVDGTARIAEEKK